MRQTQKRLVDERGRVQRPDLAFPPQVSRSQFLQLIVNERNHCMESLLIACMNTLQQFRDLHGRMPYYSTADGDVKDLIRRRSNGSCRRPL